MGVEDTGADKCKRDAAVSGVFGRKDAVACECAQSAEGCGDVAVGDAFAKFEGIFEGYEGVFDGDASTEDDADVLDDVIGEFGDIGEGCFDDFIALSFSLMER